MTKENGVVSRAMIAEFSVFYPVDGIPFSFKAVSDGFPNHFVVFY